MQIPAECSIIVDQNFSSDGIGSVSMQESKSSISTSIIGVIIIIMNLNCSLSNFFIEFKSDEIEKATMNYSDDAIIGKGAFGTVYLADNFRCIGTSVAIKVFNKVNHVKARVYVGA